MQAETREYPEGSEIARHLGLRTNLAVPLIREGEAVGVVLIRRTEVRRFTERQIDLLRTFATQAVIAIENTRLFEAERQRTHELAESLEQQTATAEVLRVISSSPGELQPVFQAMLANAVRICDAKFGNIYRWDGETGHVVAMHDTPAAFAEQRKRSPAWRPGPKTPLGRMLATKAVVHVANLATEDAYIARRDPVVVAAVELGGVRTFIAVPMLKENEPIGFILMARQDVRPFTDKQIELVTNFAAQAVIAIDNTRLLNELRQSLEQQIATADVLRVISSSPGELKPVFHSTLEKATQLCEGSFGTLFLLEGESFRRVALHNAPAKYAVFTDKNPLIPYHQSPSLNRLIETKQAVHVTDMMIEEPDAPVTKFGNARSLVTVPMLKDNELVGAIGIYRQEIRPFTD